MAAKKAPAKKMSAPRKPAPKKTKPTSAADFRKAEEATKTPTARRTDKTGSRGFGMNKGGVEARAKAAGFDKGSTLYPGGIGDYERYSGLTTWMGYQGKPKSKGKTITDKQANKIMSDAENQVRKKYGVTSKKGKK